MDFLMEDKKIYLEDENHNIIAEIEFEEIGDNTYNIYHTFVNESLRGQGIASLLVQKAVEEIKHRGGKAKASCSYAKAWIERHEV